MRCLAPAKINLLLRVGTPRADGFHPLLSWMCTVGLFDKLEVDRSPEDSVHLECDAPEVPRDASNLVIRAAHALADALAKAREGRASPASGLRIRLQKRIPAGAGLGGGSSDGAFMLQLLNELWEAGLSRDALSAIAATLGSDLSFFFYAPSAICRGRGEIVTPVAAPAAKFAMLVLPGMPMPTAAVYRRFDLMGLGRPDAVEQPLDHALMASLPAADLLPLLVNDLEPAAFAIDPELSRLRRQAEQTLSRVVRMSGSGSSLFSLFDRLDEADAAAGMIQARHKTIAMAVKLAPAPAKVCNVASTDVY